MESAFFEHEMAKAKAFITVGERPDYWAGYQRGLRRKFHGENFGTYDEHELWMGLSDDLDLSRAEKGKGYRDAYVPSYCTQNDGNCGSCSLFNYGRDCLNNTV